MPTKPTSVSQKVLKHLMDNPDRDISYEELGEIQDVPRSQVPIAVNGLLNNNIHVRKIGDLMQGLKKQVIYLSNPYPRMITQRWV